MITFAIAFYVLTVCPASILANVECGRQSPSYQPRLVNANRIINGLEAKPNSWPWMISQHAPMFGGHYLGGTLLRVRDDIEASDIVLTAAHGVGVGKTDDPSNYVGWTAFAGLHKQSDLTSKGVQMRNVIKAKHADYAGYMKDIALIKLHRPINFTDTIRPVCLPKQDADVPVGKTCVAAGWDAESKYPDALQQLLLPVHSSQDCSDMWGPLVNGQWAICAGPKDGTAGICSADSGSMLVCQEPDGRWVQYGIASFVRNTKCTVKGYPGIFARVSSFVDWIREGIREMSSLA